MSDPATILVIEDDDDIRLLLDTLLSRAGHSVVTAASGTAGLRCLFDGRPDAVILDLGLPDLDGFEVLARVREVSDVPLLVLTARGLEADKVRGLQAGADDYLTKPFGNQELTARVAALLRRRPTGAGVAGDAGGSAASEAEPGTTGDGTVTIDHATRLVTVSDREVQLTPIEFRLINAFVRHPGQVLSAEQLLDLAWGDPTGVGSDRVKFAVLRLRRQLGWTGDGPIEAVRGFGYRYQPDRD